jgi:N-acetylneuraminic acid mutarotase
VNFPSMTFARRPMVFMRRVSLAAALAGFVMALMAVPVIPQGGWTSKASLPAGRDLARAASVNGRLYVIGGHTALAELGTVDAYDPATNAWTTKASMPTPRHQMAVGVINGIIYVAGGCCPTSNALEAYDPTRDTWTTKAPMPIATEPVGAVANGILYAIGGNAHGFCTNAVQAYDPSADTWTLVSPMPTPRCHLAAAVVHNLVYAIGGTNTSGNIHFQTMEVYDSASDQWYRAADMPTGRCLLAAAVLHSKIYALGGNHPEEPKRSISTTIPNEQIYHAGGTGGASTQGIVEVYDPSTKKWAAGIPTPTARTGLAADVVGDTLYVVGGNGATPYLATNEAFRIRGTRRPNPRGF